MRYRLDDWLTAHLIDIGAISADGIGRKVRAGQCSSCYRRTLTGLDGDRAAGVAVVNMQEIDGIGEVIAIARGLPTYTMRFCGGRWELDYRSRWEIEGRSRAWPIYAKHRCDAVLPAARTVHPKLAAISERARRATSDAAPF